MISGLSLKERQLLIRLKMVAQKGKLPREELIRTNLNLTFRSVEEYKDLVLEQVSLSLPEVSVLITSFLIGEYVQVLKYSIIKKMQVLTSDYLEKLKFGT